MELTEYHREIKFRAWDKKTKRMWRSVGFRDSDCGRLYLPELGMINEENPEDPWISGRGDMILMQYTGLKDKNGKGIYEGDIVQNERETDPHYKSLEKTFEIKYEVLENCGDCTDDSGIGFNFYLKQPEELEVIGNIFENPELLTQ